MTVLLDIWVPGAPKTKGSLDMVSKHYARENVKGSVQWRCLVAERARAWRAARGLIEPSTAPVLVTGSFWLPVNSPIQSGAGDVDKLTRNVLDALQVAKKPEDARKCAGVYADDVQVIKVDMPKIASGGTFAGAHIRVLELEPGDLVAISDACWAKSLEARGGGILR